MTHDVQQFTHDVDPPRSAGGLFSPRWPDDMVARLTQYAGKFSSREISQMLSSEFNVTVSRNAVIGKMGRLGYREARRQHHHGPKPELSEAAAQREKLKRMRGPRQRAAKFEPRVIVCEPRAVPFVDLGSNECRYAVNDAAEASMHLFCGLPVKDGFSWCHQHAALVFVPPRQRTKVRAAA